LPTKGSVPLDRRLCSDLLIRDPAAAAHNNAFARTALLCGNAGPVITGMTEC
jgi:hypothetical protein